MKVSALIFFLFGIVLHLQAQPQQTEQVKAALLDFFMDK